jgi:hypothetical protein
MPIKKSTEKIIILLIFSLVKKAILVLLLLGFFNNNTNGLTFGLVPPLNHGRIIKEIRPFFPKPDIPALKKAAASPLLLPNLNNQLLTTYKADIIPHIPKQKPILNIELEDLVYIDKRGDTIGFSGTCYFADIVIVNGQAVKVNPITKKFYSLTKLKNFEETIITCQAINELGTTIIKKSLIRR